MNETVRDGQAPQETPTPDASLAGASPAIADAMEKLLSHPELLSAVASAIGLGKKDPPAAEETPTAEAIVPTTEESKSLPTGADAPARGELGDAVAAIAPLLSSFSGKGGGSSKADEQRICLLRALKPYVSRSRAEAIETIIGLSRVSELLKKMT